jgi:hypothetical protein
LTFIHGLIDEDERVDAREIVRWDLTTGETTTQRVRGPGALVYLEDFHTGSDPNSVSGFDETGTYWSVDLRTGRTVRLFDIKDGPHYRPVRVGDVVYVLDDTQDDGVLRAIDVSTGEEIARKSLGDAISLLNQRRQFITDMAILTPADQW